MSTKITQCYQTVCGFKENNRTCFQLILRITPINYAIPKLEFKTKNEVINQVCSITVKVLETLFYYL